MRRLLAFAGIFLAFSCTQAAESWQVQFFHDEHDSQFTINDIVFPSARRGIAVGYLVERGKVRPSALVTSDGGENWQFVRLREPGLSLFFLNDTVGWMVTQRNIWKTEEAGMSWRRLRRSPEGTLRVHFLDENRGWAVGARMGVHQTADGGQTWSRVPELRAVKANPEHTTFRWIAFADAQNGLIAGRSAPPPRGQERLPDWMDPERAVGQRERPTLTVLLDTRDGGASWNPSTTSMFGGITRVRLTPDGRGLSLIRFRQAFDWPSEVYRLDWKTGRSERVFRQKDRAVTDIALLPRGLAYLAAIEPPGQLTQSPVPGKVKFLKSHDLADWTEMEVDYRAVAREVSIAAFDEDHVWAATDTGMILRLVR